jgi:hypothetical protein
VEVVAHATLLCMLERHDQIHILSGEHALTVRLDIVR